MSSIPLDLERRFERRWAARFVRQVPEPSSERASMKGWVNDSVRPPKPKGKPAWLGQRA